MDTLIDNRNFPPEMQEHNQKQTTEKTPKTIGAYFILIIIGLTIVGFLIYTLFIKNPKPLLEQDSYVSEEIKESVIQLQQSSPITSPEERERTVKAFFN